MGRTVIGGHRPGLASAGSAAAPSGAAGAPGMSDEDLKRRELELEDLFQTNGSDGGSRPSTREKQMATLKEAMEQLSSLDGYVGVCVVDSNSGMMLGSHGGGSTVNLEVAAAGNTEVVRAKRKTMKSLNLNDSIEDILITLGKQYHLIRPLANREGMFIYLVLDKARANLALGRHHLAQVETDLVL